MPNGKIGDHPYTDIVVHGRDVYSPLADTLVREISTLADEKTRIGLADRLLREFNTFLDPDVPRLERLLTRIRDELRHDAKERGFEV